MNPFKALYEWSKGGPQLGDTLEYKIEPQEYSGNHGSGAQVGGGLAGMAIRPEYPEKGKHPVHDKRRMMDDIVRLQAEVNDLQHEIAILSAKINR